MDKPLGKFSAVSVTELKTSFSISNQILGNKNFVNNARYKIIVKSSFLFLAIKNKKMLTSLLLTCFLGLAPKTSIGSGKTSLAHRSVAFDDDRKAKKLNGMVLETHRLVSATDCALFCTRTPDCLSFSFCHPETCRLHSQDVFSDDFNNLIDDDSCSYRGMKREEFPKCREDGETKDILDDEEPG